MFEALSSKILAGVVSLSMLLFSNFKGNDAKLEDISLHVSGSYIYLEGRLENAFEEDFPSIFASGTQIPVNFDVDIKNEGRIVGKKRFQHKVLYNLSTGVYELKRDGQPQVFLSKSVDELIRELSRFRFPLLYQKNWRDIQIRLEASLPVVRFEKLDKEQDLMVLWKYKTASAKIRLDMRVPQ